MKPTKLWFYEKWLLKILKSGSLPKHIAFIMDGNRRFAKSQKKPVAYGHEQGLESLKKCLEWCLNLEIENVTVFAFAIENFNREKSEVETLLNLAKVNLFEMAQHDNFLQNHSIKVKIIGNLELLPEAVRARMIEVMKLTEGNNKLTLNICFSYNSMYELEVALLSLREDYLMKKIEATNITPKALLDKMMINNEPDLVIRTSNEIRLSNFMLYQSSDSNLIFLKDNWPAIKFWSFIKIILDYQLNEKKLRFYRNYFKESESKFN